MEPFYWQPTYKLYYYENRKYCGVIIWNNGK